jgi:hypothetical protein
MTTDDVAVGRDGRVSIMLRRIGPALAFIALASIAVFAADVVLRVEAGLEDLREAHSTVSRQNDRAVEQMLFAALERTRAASLLASRVAGAIAGVALTGAIVFAVVGTASRWARFSTLAVVILLLFRAFFWKVI